MAAGPQAWHILRSSRVSIFLLDSSQSYRENETTTVESICEWASEFGIPNVGRISLADHQFRCGGSTEYVRWLETLLELPTSLGPTDGWKENSGTGVFEFEMALTPRRSSNTYGKESRQGTAGD